MIHYFLLFRQVIFIFRQIFRRDANVTLEIEEYLGSWRYVPFGELTDLFPKCLPVSRSDGANRRWKLAESKKVSNFFFPARLVGY